tara:strand:- start:218 stop:865 length:648 start_codon:yes stop_codon:yes gene_type:complete
MHNLPFGGMGTPFRQLTGLGPSMGTTPYEMPAQQPIPSMNINALLGGAPGGLGGAPGGPGGGFDPQGLFSGAPAAGGGALGLPPRMGPIDAGMPALRPTGAPELYPELQQIVDSLNLSGGPLAGVEFGGGAIGDQSRSGITHPTLQGMTGITPVYGGGIANPVNMAPPIATSPQTSAAYFSGGDPYDDPLGIMHATPAPGDPNYGTYMDWLAGQP